MVRESERARLGVPLKAGSPQTQRVRRRAARGSGLSSRPGALVVNADDWGRDRATTDCIGDCVALGAVSSVSAMVFMQDSERAAKIAQQRGICVGLHLNFTTPFSGSCSAKLSDKQHKLGAYLRWSAARAIFHPGLAECFEYVVKAQMDEFQRLYRESPSRVDGHHHVHLCANVLLGGLLEAGVVVRPHFSYERGEKHVHTVYRAVTRFLLKRRYRATDYLFSLTPLEQPGRLEGIFALSDNSVVEVETHPIEPEEYQFLTSGEIFRVAGGIPIASGPAIPGYRQPGVTTVTPTP